MFYSHKDELPDHVREDIEHGEWLLVEEQWI